MASFLRNASLALAVLALAGGCGRGEPAAADAADAPGSAGIAESLGKAVTEAVTPSSARQRLERTMTAMAGLESFQMDVVSAGPSLPAAASMSMKMEFVAPDRYRITTPMGTHVVIGNTSYMAMGGGKPVVMQLDDKFEPDVADLGMDDSTTVEDLGSDSVDGQRATKYLVRDADPNATALHLWVGADDRLLQLRSAEPDGTNTTVRYSRYNDSSIRIDPPQ